MSLRIAFFSHNGFGLGHASRNLKLARGLLAARPGADVLIITGSSGLHELPIPAHVDYVKLPSVRKQATDRWRPQALDIEMEHLIALRRTIILESVRAYRPHLFVADFLPLGVEGELMPTLQELKDRKDAHTVIGFRDILDDPDVVRRGWERDGTMDALTGLYDMVLVYGEQKWFDFSAYGLPADLPRYVGRLGDPSAASRLQSTGNDLRLVATCGGGADGYPMLAAALEAGAELAASAEGSVKVNAYTGTLMAESDVERLRQIAKPGSGRVHRFAEDLSRKLGRSTAVIGMAGANTVDDILSYRRRAVIVPRPGPSREQLIRARLLSERGLATVLPLGQCTGETLAEALRALLRDRGDYPESAVPDLNGVRRSVEALLELAG